MKKIYLIVIALTFAILAKGQTFTIAQSITGASQDVFGQGFTPSIQGSGTGSVGTEKFVGLYEFSLMLNATVKPNTLYIYEVLPESKEVLIDGTGGILVGQSISKTEESYWYTNYKFNSLALDKDKKYYALFREAVNCEIGVSDYSGGNIYRLGSDGSMNTSEYVDTRFKASFAPPAPTSLDKNHASTLNIYPITTDGEIFINSEVPTIINVYALTGVKIKTIEVDCGQNTTSIAELPKGIYLFVSDSNQICKVVKR